MNPRSPLGPGLAPGLPSVVFSTPSTVSLVSPRGSRVVFPLFLLDSERWSGVIVWITLLLHYFVVSYDTFARPPLVFTILGDPIAVSS